MKRRLVEVREVIGAKVERHRKTNLKVEVSDEWSRYIMAADCDVHVLHQASLCSLPTILAQRSEELKFSASGFAWAQRNVSCCFTQLSYQLMFHCRNRR